MNSLENDVPSGQCIMRCAAFSQGIVRVLLVRPLTRAGPEEVYLIEDQVPHQEDSFDAM